MTYSVRMIAGNILARETGAHKGNYVFGVKFVDKNIERVRLYNNVIC